MMREGGREGEERKSKGWTGQRRADWRNRKKRREESERRVKKGEEKNKE